MGSKVRATLVALVAAGLPGVPVPAAAGRVHIDWPGSIHIQSEDGDRLKLRLSEDGRTLKVEARGKFELNDEESDIERVEPGGYLRIEERRHGFTRRRYEARGAAGGRVERTYRTGGRTSELDAEGRAWLADVLGIVVRNTTFAAESHVRRLLAQGGVEAVLLDIEKMESDHAQGVYFRALLEQVFADAEVARRIARAAALEIGSDHTLAELVLDLAEEFPKRDDVLAACAEATRELGSDHERRRALQGILVRGQAGPAVLPAVLESALGIGSDHELAEVLCAFTDLHPLDAALADPYLAAVDRIGSDYERRRTLVSLLAREPTDPAVLASVARGADGIGSSHERAEVLIALAGLRPLGDDIAPAFFQAADGIGSDHEHARVLKAVVREGEVAPDVLEALVASARKIGSDHERAQVLLEVARELELDETTRAALVDAARDIGSTSERDRVLDALHETSR